MPGRRSITFIAAALATAALAAPAYAVNDFDVLVEFTDNVTVGTSGNAGTIFIQNNSTAPHGTATIDNILLDPSCVDPTSEMPCPNNDPGVFAVGNGTGAPGTACAGDTFSYGPTIVAGVNGFNRVGGPLSLPATDVCLINFTFSVLKMPTTDGQPGEDGVQTNQNLGVQADNPPNVGSETFNSIDFTTVIPAPPQPVPQQPAPIAITPGPTGQQAAALAACAKKKSKKKRKKCRKRARQLPV